MSQVKNLRAMFEKKRDKSPPDRGRSPDASTSSANLAGSNDSGSPRPLSKVRTNFVAIEKDGRMGLRRDHSGESSLSRRRMSIETDLESTSTFPEKPALTSDGARRVAAHESVSDLTLQPPDETQPSQVARPKAEQPPTNTKRLTNPVESSSATLKSADWPIVPTPDRISGATHTAENARKENKANGSVAASTATAAAASKETIARPASARPEMKSTPKKTKTATQKSTQNPKESKSATEASDRSGGRRADTASSVRTSAAPTSKPRPTHSSIATKVPSAKGISNEEPAFVKPKPKSPTKPISLPASLMAPTASSVSKGNFPRRSLSRQSGSLQNLKAASHSARASSSIAPAPSQHAKRPGSAFSRTRPSVGLPPNKPESDANAAKRQNQVDEGFLARMMRPTQSSSSKTTDKVPSTPPKKIAPRPSAVATADGTSRQGISGRRPAATKDQVPGKSECERSQPSEFKQSPENVPREPSEPALADATPCLESQSNEIQKSPTLSCPGFQSEPEPDPSRTEFSETALTEMGEEIAPGAQDTVSISGNGYGPDATTAPGSAVQEDLVAKTARGEVGSPVASSAREDDVVHNLERLGSHSSASEHPPESSGTETTRGLDGQALDLQESNLPSRQEPVITSTVHELAEPHECGTINGVAATTVATASEPVRSASTSREPDVVDDECNLNSLHDSTRIDQGQDELKELRCDSPAISKPERENFEVELQSQ
ncbi:hypothetical protein CDD83_1530 [Cordyceps sp. RAO-2017]|nr:hypothetical protein CDD83_1530 [Cordyceps sp. RAO-2017]